MRRSIAYHALRDAAMKLGFSLPVSGAWATPANQVKVAREAERLGYHSLWVLQRLLYPVTPQNDYPPMPGRAWPDAFESVADPVVSLAFVAGVTSRIRLGTSVLVMPYYTPIMLAKQLATLDHVSEGRLTVGLGVGWSRDEYDAVGVPFDKRGRRADEFLACLKAIWTQEHVEFGSDPIVLVGDPRHCAGLVVVRNPQDVPVKLKRIHLRSASQQLGGCGDPSVIDIRLSAGATLMTLFGSLVVVVMAATATPLVRLGGKPILQDKIRKVFLGTAAIYFWLCYSLMALARISGPHRPDAFYDISIMLMIVALLLRYADRWLAHRQETVPA